MVETDVTTAVFGIRHHGPGSARSLVGALGDFDPDLVLIEGPADADPLIAWAASERMQPPVALLAYAVDEPSRAAFWPFAVFSPEWQALHWAAGRGVPARFCDLPAAVSLARRSTGQLALPTDEPTDEPADEPTDELTDGLTDGLTDELTGESPEAADDEPGPAALTPGTGSRRRIRVDPLARLAEVAGYDDPERWWEDVVESRRDETAVFAELVEAMAELRAELPAVDPLDVSEEARREAYMRQTIRGALKEGYRRIAVVCGAWHAPVLTLPMPPASHDARLLRGLPRQKVRLTWVPWTHSRLSTASGYGAGITSPGWYAHLWSAPDHPISRWLTRVAGVLRTKDLATSSAHVIESVRLAETLATLRGRPLAGLSEVQDATQAVLCDGSPVLLGFVTSELVVGQALGAVDPDVPTVPLEADLLKQCRTLRLKRDAAPKRHDLDLRKPTDLARSVLFHRLRVLELAWIRPAESEVANRGTFRETWQSQWRPEYAISLVEAATWGTTVAAAAGAKIIDTAAARGLVEQTAVVERCLFADLPEALGRLLSSVARRAALDADVVHLMDALPPLARAQRYGDVRGTDTGALAQVAETLVVRICGALKPALIGLDENSARSMRQRVDAVHQAVDLLAPGLGTGGLMERWLDALSRVLDADGVHAAIAGRVLRILFDAERLHDPGVRLHRALSYGAPVAEKAAWVEGFFADGALLLIHDDDLLGLVDSWLAELGEGDFVDVLPLVRRTFGSFSPAERRLIGERLDRRRAPSETLGSTGPAAAPEPELAAPALATVDRILGWVRW